MVDKRHDHLLATLTVNVLGCLALGMFAASALLNIAGQLVLGIGAAAAGWSIVRA